MDLISHSEAARRLGQNPVAVRTAVRLLGIERRKMPGAPNSYGLTVAEFDRVRAALEGAETVRPALAAV
jgi:hypothetical protein